MWCRVWFIEVVVFLLIFGGVAALGFTIIDRGIKRGHTTPQECLCPQPAPAVGDLPVQERIWRWV